MKQLHKCSGPIGQYEFFFYVNWIQYPWVKLVQLYHVLGNMFGFSTLSGKTPQKHGFSGVVGGFGDKKC